jgi:hypothetical protein
MTMGKIDISCDNCKFEKRCLKENSSATRYATGFICYEKESREMFNLIDEAGKIKNRTMRNEW